MEKAELRRQREIEKWERERAKPKKNWYFAWLVFVVCLIYATDEIASQIGTLMKTEIANDLFASFGQSSVGMLDILGVMAIPFQVVCMFYKPLADKWGRKTFLVRANSVCELMVARGVSKVCCRAANIVNISLEIGHFGDEFCLAENAFFTS